ncbi:lysophospholipase L1-like esterase [Phycicoccus badiiscoriae]|uniref:Lysophospholipase L1-like esterase n=1 Tax=Pedococcus badiiscoriae TaxID=642776 RepID=A0A852WAH9_9MICO|nr:lysophospholipase L1-like esterase [Pedococcus badiiscoriae]
MSDPTFTPSAEFQVASDGPRDVGMVFVGASLVAGVGDPKGQGWVSRVVGRTHSADLELTAYNLGVRGDTTGDVLARWKPECAPRWRGRAEKRLVISVGTADAMGGVTLARHRLNLANILDDAASAGIGTFVVSPPPTEDEELNAKLDVLVEAQADVCGRRTVPFVDCFRPLLGHEQWQSDLAASRVAHHPGQAGYGLIAWLVLHNGWYDWLQISPS